MARSLVIHWTKAGSTLPRYCIPAEHESHLYRAGALARAGRSCRDQQYLVVSVHLGIGAGMVSRAVTFSFDTHHVDRIDTGVDADNVVAITCYRRQGFKYVGTWPHAMEAGPKVIDVYWMDVLQLCSRAEGRG